MASPLLIPVGYQFFDNSGKPLAGGFLYTYAAGTTSTLATYSDDALLVQLPNPIPLNSAGRCVASTLAGAPEVNVYPLSASYKLVLTDSGGTTVWTHDNVDPAAASTVSLSFPVTVVSGISGGIPGFTSATTMAASAVLAANALMLGGGPGSTPTTDSNVTIDPTSHQLNSATQYRTRAYNSTTQSITSGADTAVTFDTEDFDVGGLHSTVTNTSRFTVPASGGGLFVMTANVFLAASGTGILSIDWKLNGTTKIGTGQFIGNSAANAVQVEHTTFAVLAAGDYVEVIVNQNSGGPLNIGSATRTLASQAQIVKLW